jgi:hypothetical protein
MGKRMANRGPIFWGIVAVVAATTIGGVGWLVVGGGSETTPEAPAEESWTWSEEPSVDDQEAEARPAEESTGEAEPAELEPAEKVAEVEEAPEDSASPDEEADGEREQVTAESETPARLPDSKRSDKRPDDETSERSELAKVRPPARVGQSGKSGRMPEEYKPAVLRIVTNFEKADATVNGLPYPEYSERSDKKGMVLPAGGPYNVKVTYDGKSKSYRISLRPYEVRYLMVELSGFKGGGPVTPSPSRNATGDSAKAGSQNDQDGRGRVTVYSKPKGTIHVDGSPKKQQTPGTVQVAAGQHNIQVEFEGGEMSEKKTVRVRKGSRIKLFFRKRD